MSIGNDITIEAVRLAMSMHQMQAENASRNIASANIPGAQATRLDFGSSQGLLQQAAALSSRDENGLLAALTSAGSQPLQGESVEGTESAINLDQEVADMASANLEYQALTESLNRHFGLMRLAITGRN